MIVAVLPSNYSMHLFTATHVDSERIIKYNKHRCCCILLIVALSYSCGSIALHGFQQLFKGGVIHFNRVFFNFSAKQENEK